MADTKLADLTALTTPSGDDILYVVDDPAGTPLDRKIALSDVFKRGTVTTSSPVIDAAQTWNDGGVTFTGMKLNVTDTASAAASVLMDLQVGGSARLSVAKDGDTTFADGTVRYLTIRPSDAINQTSIQIASDMNFMSGAQGVWGYGLEGLRIGSLRTLAFGAHTNNTGDVILGRRAAANLRFGAADAAAPVAQTLSVQSASATGADQAGADFTITGSQGRGGGAGGSIIFQVAPAGTPGSGAQNALATALTIGSNRDATFTGNLVVNEIQGPTQLNITVGGARSAFFKNGFTLRVTNPTINFGSDGAGDNSDLVITRDAANTLALRNGANAQAFRVYNTYTSATDFERGNIYWDSNVLKIGTEKGSTGGTARALEFQTDGTTRLTIAADSGNITTTGTLTTAGNVSLGASGTRYVGVAPQQASNSGYLGFSSGSGGSAWVTVGSTSTVSTFGIGGNGAGVPGLKESGTTLKIVLANSTTTLTDLEAKSMKTDAPTGGTAAAWKLGTVATVSPTSPNRTIEVDIGGTIYYLSAKTTND